MNVRPLILLAAFVPAFAALAQDGSDPPNRVARIALLEGNVSLEPSGVDQFSAAEVNYPLTAGDRIYADNQALTELQTSGLALRLGNGADLTVTTLTDFTAQFGLAQGSLRLRTRDLDAPDGNQGVVEIDTSNGAIVIQRPGDIRVDSYPQDDTTIVTVTTGQVEITGNGVDQVLYPNQSVRLTGNPASLEGVEVLPPDPLDRFDYERERGRQQSLAVSAQYVDADMIGVADLGQYGDWDQSPVADDQSGDGGQDYGAVWFPHAVPAGWTPYSNGHWAWVVPWGWTWVEAEPWGFAPFHYGRWAQFGGRWGWIPGPPPSVFATGGRPFHPVYSPALVAFVGGPGFSVSLGFGGASGAGITAWFPLGPREPFVPWYHASPGYVNRVNVTNLYTRNVAEVHNTYINRTTVVYNTTVNNTYINRRQATVAVPQRDFAAGHAVAQSQPVRFNPQQRQALAAAPILPHPLVTPASSIAAPQAPPRVVPPNAARPVLQSRSGEVYNNRGNNGSNNGSSNGNPGSRPGAPINRFPPRPGVTIERAPAQPSSQPQPDPVRRGQSQPNQPLPSQSQPSQNQPSQNQPGQNQPGQNQSGQAARPGQSGSTAQPQPGRPSQSGLTQYNQRNPPMQVQPIQPNTPAQKQPGSNQPNQPSSPANVRQPGPGQSVESFQPGRSQQPAKPQPGQTQPGQGQPGQAQQGQPQRGAYPIQRNPQPAPVSSGPVATPFRPSPAPASPSQAPAVNLPAHHVPQPVVQPQAQPGAQRNASPQAQPVSQPRVLVTNTPPQPQAPSFNQQQRAIQRNDPGRPLGPQQLENLRNNRPAGPAAQPEPAPHPAPAANPRNQPPAPNRANTNQKPQPQ